MFKSLFLPRQDTIRPLYESQTFVAETITNLHVGHLNVANKLTFLMKQTILEAAESGYTFRIDVLDFYQQANDPLNLLFGEMFQLNSQLVFKTDSHCNILRIINREAILIKWLKIKPSLVEKYTHPEVQKLFDHFERQISKDDGSLEASMMHKGIYGLIFNGVYGYDLRKPVFSICKQIKNFFGEIDFHFRVENYESEFEDRNNLHSVVLKGAGYINQDKFDLLRLQQTIKVIIDNFIFKAEPDFRYVEEYEINRRNGVLIKAQQDFKLIIENFYYHEMTHKIQNQAYE